MVDDVRPDQTSIDYEAMVDYWEKVSVLLEGEDAVRAGGERFLKRFPNEPLENYQYRLGIAKYTNVFQDLIEGLASKPFSKELRIKDGAPDAIAQFAEDVDGAGNHIHVFASGLFFDGIANAISWILVDHTKVPSGATRADERSMGARPYWVHINPMDLIWVETAQIGGREEFVYAAIRENETVREGCKQSVIERRRLLIRDRDPETGAYSPARYEVYRKSSKGWAIEDEGPIAIGVIPLVPFIAGRRKGGSWQIHPPMRSAADLQLTHYRQETNLEAAKEQTAFPMLAGNGITPPIGEDGQIVDVPIGPSAVLYAPPSTDGSHGEWVYIEPSAQSLKFLSDEVDKTERQLRELGRQPLTVNSGNLTVVTTAFAAAKGNSAVQAWAFLLKDALEMALIYTCRWLSISASPEVEIHTDFDVEQSGTETMGQVLQLKTAGLISRAAALDEAKRRGIMSPEYDPEADRLQIANDPIYEPDNLAGGMPDAITQDGNNGA